MGWKINIDVQYERERKKKNEKRRKKSPENEGKYWRGCAVDFFPRHSLLNEKKATEKRYSKNFDNEVAKENPFSSPFLRKKEKNWGEIYFEKLAKGNFFPSLWLGGIGGVRVRWRGQRRAHFDGSSIDFGAPFFGRSEMTGTNRSFGGGWRGGKGSGEVTNFLLNRRKLERRKYGEEEKKDAKFRKRKRVFFLRILSLPNIRKFAPSCAKAISQNMYWKIPLFSPPVGVPPPFELEFPFIYWNTRV